MAAACAAHAASETIIMNSIDANGIGKKVGTLDLSDTKTGLRVTPRLTDLPPGDHPAAGMPAGGHYDPADTGKHLGPQGDGHKGDMPVLTVEASGKATKAATVPHLTLADAKGRSIVIHAGGDDYSDQPAPSGGGGARIACGVVK